MNLNNEQKIVIRELSDAVNSAVESSERVKSALADIRNLGLEPNLRIKLDIELFQTTNLNNESQEIKLELTEQDLQTLRGMKISIEDL